MERITPVILAGGSGTRLWPLSRQLNPKQFLKLLGNQTLFQQTLLRLHNLPCTEPTVVCNEEHRFLVAEQLQETGILNANIILEPLPRGTAPAAILAALHSLGKDKNPTLLILPADHIIETTENFTKTVIESTPEAEKGRIVALGVTPTRAEISYGYIKIGNKRDKNTWSIAEFIEKPDFPRSSMYFNSGDYWWNTGILLVKASTLLAEASILMPEILETCTKAVRNAKKDLGFLRISMDDFQKVPANSIDYALMEKTAIASVVELNTEWSDIGTWGSLWEAVEKDAEGVALLGDAKVIDVKNSLVRAESRFVATIGVEDLIVIETKDAVLVAHRDHVQKIKSLVTEIRKSGRHEHLNQREVFRPWGSYDLIGRGDRYQVKKITVKPGEKTSLQMHHHRAEHWIVVRGTAKVTINDKVLLISENESTYIPVGKVHSLENPGKIPLELVEVQSGSYLGEDDIVRFEDKYGR